MLLPPLCPQFELQPQSPGFLLRIDRVGSFRLILEEAVLLCGPGREPSAGAISVMGQLSGQHAWIKRCESGYWLEPARGSVVRNAAGDKPELLAAGCWMSKTDTFRLDSEIQMCLSTPSRLSNTAVVKIEPRDRLVDRVDGIILLDRLLVLGPTAACHISCRHWQKTAAIVYRDNKISFHSPLTPGGGNAGEKIDLSIEPSRYHCVNEEIGLYLETYPVSPSRTGFQA